MLPLRYPKLWLAVGWVLVAGVVIGSLGPSGVVMPAAVSDKILHAASYFLLMIWFAGLYPRAMHPLIGVVLLLLGIGLDLGQSLTATRTLDLLDIAANGVGILLGLALSLWWLEGWCQRLELRLLR